MQNLTNKDSIITSLLTYMPLISNSLVELVNSVKNLAENPAPRESSDVKDILDHLMKVVDPALKLARATTNIKDSDIDQELVSLYKTSMINVVAGVKLMHQWLSDSNIPDDKLRESVDQLFTGCQQIFTLVDKLTKP